MSIATINPLRAVEHEYAAKGRDWAEANLARVREDRLAASGYAAVLLDCEWDMRRLAYKRAFGAYPPLG